MLAANIKDIPGVLDVLSIASPRVGSPPPVYFKVHESCLQLNRNELTWKEQKWKEMKGHEWKWKEMITASSKETLGDLDVLSVLPTS